MRLLLLALLSLSVSAAPFFEIHVIDEDTGRGIPGVELESVNHLRYLTDSAGRIAYSEPGHENRTVFFHTRSHGYEFPRDGFGMTGRRMTIVPGKVETIKARRVNLAERLYRTTGEGIYRDSILLGKKVPLTQPLLNADVAGQDSIQRAIYRGKIHWFWGDTPRVSYPLGNFRMSGATSELPSRGGLDPSAGINYQYFTNASGGPKEMFPIKPPGELIWADGFLVLTNRNQELMLAHFQRLKGLDKPLSQGLAIFNDEKQEFELLRSFSLDEKWRFPQGHPILHDEHFLFGINFPNVRVPADYDSVTNSGAYEAWSCLSDDAAELVPYRWTKTAPPTGPNEEKKWVDQGRLKVEQAHFLPRDHKSGRVVTIHGGSVAWNAFRKKWILIAVEIGGSSMLGEIWFSEADLPTGPWRVAHKVVSHDKYSFYNPAHHPFFDQQGGRLIFFEGTYTLEFSGGPFPTPRYDYNNMLYRLDLAKIPATGD